jgi:hypothetical protein
VVLSQRLPERTGMASCGRNALEPENRAESIVNSCVGNPVVDSRGKCAVADKGGGIVMLDID